MLAAGSKSRLLKAATELRKAVSVLARKGPNPFLAESHLRLRMYFARQYVQTEGCRFDSTLLPPAVVREVLGGKYEVNERQALSWIDPSLPLVECGAGLGILACLANRRLINPGQHVLIEANPELLPVLARHRALNGCRFEVLNRAVGYGGATTEFFVCRNPLASSRERRSPRKIEVPTVTLNELLEPYQSATVICDIEGSEVELVARETEAWAKVRTLVLEVHEELVGAEAIRTTLATLQTRDKFRLAAQLNDLAVLTK
jgi:FkbM family methyltransferase